MAKISELPELVEPTGIETVVVLDGGETKRIGVEPLVTAAAAPVLALARDYTDAANDNRKKAAASAQFARTALAHYPETQTEIIEIAGSTPAAGGGASSTGFRASATALVQHDGTVKQIEDWFTRTGTVAYWFWRLASGTTWTLFRIVPLTVTTIDAVSVFAAGTDFAAFDVQQGDLFGPRLVQGQASIATRLGARYFTSTALGEGATATLTATSGDAPVTRLTVARTEVTTPTVPPAAEIARAAIPLDLPSGGPSYDVWNTVGQSQVALQGAASSDLPPNAVPSDARVPMQRIYETALAFDNSAEMWGARANPDVTAAPFVMSMVRGAGANIHGFCEGRQSPGGDDVGMVVMEMLSTTLGRSWAHTGRTLVKDVAPDGTVNRCANPRGSYNPLTGKLWLDWSWFARDGSGAFGLRAIYRDDRDGKWYGPNGEFVPGSGIANTFNLSALTQPGWKRILSGPGAGDVGTDGKLYIPIWYDHPQYETYGTAVARLNDDGTATMIWYGGLFYDIVGEPTLVALENGRLHLNCRQRGSAYYARHILEIAVAGNIGTLVDHWIDTGLPDPHCEGSLTRLSGKGDGKPSRLVFVNCNSTTARTRLTARVSYREGAKGSYSAPAPLWPDSEIRFEDCLGGALATPVQIDHTGGYSAVCRIDDTHFAVLAQKNSIKPGGAVTTSGCLVFAIFSIGNAL